MIGVDLVDYLSSKGVRTFKAAGAEVTARCWWCPTGHGGNKGKGKLYLNTDTWLWSCKVCCNQGGRKMLLEHFGDDRDTDVSWLPGTDPGLRRKALTEAADLAADWLLNNPKVLDYLTSRGLSPQTIVDAKLGYVPASWGLGTDLKRTNNFLDLKHAGLLTAEGQEFFSGHITIPYSSHGNVVQLRGRAYTPGKELSGAKYVTPAGDNVRLFNADSLQGARDAIICEGELDCLALLQTLRRSPDPTLRMMAVVAISGSASLPQSFAGYFSECRKVYVALDPDDAGRSGAERIGQMLGSKARAVELPDDLPACDWSDYLAPKGTGPHAGHGWQDVLQLLSVADSVGRTLYTPYDALRQWQHIESQVGGILTGIEGLDRYITPGLKPGQMMIPIARTGAGKSAFLATLLYNMRSRPQLIVSLELTAAEFWDRLMRIARFYDPLLTDEAIAHMFAKTRIYDKRLKPGDLVRLAEEFNDDMGEPAQVVGVDYIGYASKNYPGQNQYERVTRAVLELKEDAKTIGAAIIAPHQAGRSAAGGVPVRAEDARDSGAVEDTADIMLGLFLPSEADASVGFNGGVNCSILKNRNGRKGVQTSLLFSLMSLVMVEKASPWALVAEDENRLILTGDTYQRALEYRRKGAQTQLRLA